MESESNEAEDIVNNKEEEKFINENGKFYDDKIKKKKFEEMMKIIEGIFTGNYSNKTNIYAITYKDLTTVYSKQGVKEKDKYLPQTPLNLYYSSKELLAKYINNHFHNDKENYDELLNDILSLLFYFKIPYIG